MIFWVNQFEINEVLLVTFFEHEQNVQLDGAVKGFFFLSLSLSDPREPPAGQHFVWTGGSKAVNKGTVFFFFLFNS